MANAVARTYTTRRRAIVKAIATELRLRLDGQYPFRTRIAGIEERLKFWDEVVEFPTIHIGAGAETREYETAGFRFRLLQITIRCFVSDDDDVIHALETVLEDVETVLENADPLTYYDASGASQTTAQTTVLSVDTDEGVLEPLGVGEVVVEIRY